MLQTSSTRRPAKAAATLNLGPTDRHMLSENELANRWGMSPKTLQRWRTEGRGPHFLKLSKRVTYPLDVVIEYERSAMQMATSQYVDR